MGSGVFAKVVEIKVNPSETIAPEYGSKMDTNGPTKVILFSV